MGVKVAGFVCELGCRKTYSEEWQYHLHCQQAHERQRWLPVQYNEFEELPPFKERHP